MPGREPPPRPRPLVAALWELLYRRRDAPWGERLGSACSVVSAHHAYRRRDPDGDWSLARFNRLLFDGPASVDFGAVLEVRPTEGWLLQAARLVKRACAHPPPRGFAILELGRELPECRTNAGDSVALFVRNRLFALESEHLALPAPALVSVLEECVARAATPNVESPGPLSCDAARQQQRWLASARATAELGDGLRFLERCRFALCLEPDRRPASPYDAGADAFPQLPENRWFNFGFQAVVFRNGACAAVLSHRLGFDGLPARRWLGELALGIALEERQTADTDWGACAPVRELPWRRPHLLEVSEALNAAQTIHRLRRGTLLVRHGVGGRFFRHQGVSPDAMFQLALWLWVSQQTFPGPRRVGQMVDLSRTFRHARIGYRTTMTPEIFAVLSAVTDEAPREAVLHRARAASTAHLRALEAFRKWEYPGEYLDFLLRWDRPPLPPPLPAPGSPLPFLSEVTSSSLPPVRGVIATGRFGVELPGVTQLTLHYTIRDASLQLLITPSQYLDSSKTPESVAEELFETWEGLAELFEEGVAESSRTEPVGWEVSSEP